MITTLWLTDVETSARMDRGILTDLFTEGIKDVQGGQFKVIPRAAGANMTVTVQKGTTDAAVAYIVGDDVADQGLYRVAMDATIPDLAVAAAPSSGTRTDLVVLEVVDKSAVGGIVNVSRPRVITGQSALAAADKTMIVLARITLTAGTTTSIQAGNITDLRTQAGAASLKVGTQAQPLTSAQLAALTASEKYAGRLVFNTDTKRGVLFDGTDATPLGGAAFGTTPVGVLTLSTTFQTAAYFIGTGFQQVDFTFGPVNGAGGGTGAWITAVSDATKARGIITAGTSSVIVNPSTVTDNYTFVVGGSTNGRIRNIRLDSDGYLRMELGTVTGSYSTTATDRINWGAR